jgi:hypothetical protein
MLNGRLVYFTHDEMTYVDCSDPNHPRVEAVLPLPLPVTDGVWHGDRLYTVGERGLALYDISTWPPVLIDHGGRPGSLLATDGEVVATSNGSSISIYYLHEDKLWRVESDPSLPDRFELAQNYPNPFNPITFIEFSLPHPARIKLEVFNVLGQTVATLVDGERTAGYHTISWDGRDGSGSLVASGVYIYRVSAGGFRASAKMILIR